MKKIVALMLALVMVLVAMSAMASGDVDDPAPAATPNTTGSDNSGYSTTMDAKASTNTITITKTYDITEGKTNPDDTLKFTVTSVSFENDGVTEATKPTTANMPKPTIADVNVSNGATSAAIKVALPAYFVPGVYTYTIKETDGNIAGVTYLDENGLTMKVTVVNGTKTEGEGADAKTVLDPTKLVIGGIALRKGSATSGNNNKVDAFENKYEAGSLEISKTVTGNLGDTTKVWNFTVTLKAPAGDKVNADIVVTGTKTSLKENDTEITGNITKGWEGTKTLALQLKHGESIKLDNLPKNVEYEITETEQGEDGYTTTVDVSETTDQADDDNKVTGKITASAEDDHAYFTNDKDITIDTGIALDSIPYIMMMVVAMMGIAVLALRRRKEEL